MVGRRSPRPFRPPRVCLSTLLALSSHPQEQFRSPRRRHPSSPPLQGRSHLLPHLLTPLRFLLLPFLHARFQRRRPSVPEALLRNRFAPAPSSSPPCLAPSLLPPLHSCPPFDLTRSASALLAPFRAHHRGRFALLHPMLQVLSCLPPFADDAESADLPRHLCPSPIGETRPACLACASSHPSLALHPTVHPTNVFPRSLCSTPLPAAVLFLLPMTASPLSCRLLSRGFELCSSFRRPPPPHHPRVRADALVAPRPQ